jgi:FMN phosphatase YigB (HAD superfamily)
LPVANLFLKQCRKLAYKLIDSPAGKCYMFTTLWNVPGHFCLVMSTIKNVIFDLGNVLLDIDYDKTAHAFEQLGFPDFKTHYSATETDLLFQQLETGRISDTMFYDRLKKISTQPVSNEQIKHAWNALLLDFRKESLDHLTKISSRYNLYLLSNTNIIHQDAFDGALKNSGGDGLDSYFIKAYYSHLMGMRKPDIEIYSFVLHDAGLIAEETLFIDDLANNIAGAALAGLKTHHLLPGERIEKLPLIQG